jgi:uncharacterized membrane protein YvbJ
MEIVIVAIVAYYFGKFMGRRQQKQIRRLEDAIDANNREALCSQQ